MATTKVAFTGSQGFELQALLDLPDHGDPKAYALFAHCFTCSKNLKAVTHISRALAAEGVAVLRFDFTGLGESDGDFANTNFTSNVQDLLKAAEHLADNFDGPKILIGHSLGGAAVLQAARDISSCAAVVTIGAPYEPEHVVRMFDDLAETIEERGEARVSLGGRQFTIKKQFVDDLTDDKYVEGIRAMREPLLIFHSPTDDTVGIDNAAQIFNAARHPKSFISLDGADHLLSNANDSRYVGRVIAEWASRYV